MTVSLVTILFWGDPDPINGRMATLEEDRRIVPHLTYCDSQYFYTRGNYYICQLCEEKL